MPSSVFLIQRKLGAEVEYSCHLQFLSSMQIPTIFKKRGSSLFGKLKAVVSKRPISLETLKNATGNFSNENKIGEGGFGPVYKGVLIDGKEIAVKTLSRTCGQGETEFVTEVRLLAKFRHENLVQLFGYCIEGSERLLVYEFLPNKSLDNFLFDSLLSKQLDWEMRFNIILGIARGLVHLHENSPQRIIHRGITASNILLDQRMNPKISDFGFARLIGEDESHVSTRVAGTIGYIAPEYMMSGQLSVMADVYSFGVLLLEIVSGRRITDLEDQTLIERAWRSFERKRAVEVIDANIVENCAEEKAMKCIHVGLLCTQKDPHLRPNMSNVYSTLSNPATTDLPNPAKPHFDDVWVSRECEITSVKDTGDEGQVSNVYSTLSNPATTDLPNPARPHFDDVWVSRECEITSVKDTGEGGQDTHKPLSLTDTATSNLADNEVIEMKSYCNSFYIIGEGSFGKVYRGIIRGRDVAIKKIKHSSNDNRTFLENEVRLLQGKDHKNIVGLIAWCIEEEEFYLVYEYVNGCTLQEYLRGNGRGPCLGWKQCLKIIQGIAEGIQFLHNNHIIHVDIKPQNLMLNRADEIKIIDFGFSRHVNWEGTHRSTDRIIGTRGYWAPEYCMYHKLSYKHDVYSFGIVVLEVITGQRHVDDARGSSQFHIPEYVKYMMGKNRFEAAVDQRIKGEGWDEHALKSAMVVAELALRCADGDRERRPDMDSVVRLLNSVALDNSQVSNLTWTAF